MKLWKPLVIVLLMILLPAVSMFARVEKQTMASGVSVNSTAADTTVAWAIQHGEYFSIQAIGVGSVDLEIAYQLSHDGTDWGPEAGVNATDPLVANFTSTTWQTYSISPMVALFMRFIVTGNAGNGASGVTYTLIAQQWKK